MKIKVQEDIWNNRMCYLGFMKYSEIEKIVDIKEDQSMNRKVKKERVDEIVKYINENHKTIFFPPVILNSCEKIIVNKNETFVEIELIDKSLTVIDGQHRISAINEIMKDSGIKNRIKDKKISFFLLEDLKDKEHRHLFNLINDNAMKVEKTVSERFKISKENMYGLRFVKNHTCADGEGYNAKSMIEWELKQSNDKICYLFITEMNTLLLKVIKDYKLGDNDEDDICEFDVIDNFWDKYFSFISSLNDNVNKSFYVMKITLRMLVEAIKGTYEEPNIELRNYRELIERVNSCFENLLLVSEQILYKGNKKQCHQTYKNIYEQLLDSQNEAEEVQ